MKGKSIIRRAGISILAVIGAAAILLTSCSNEPKTSATGSISVSVALPGEAKTITPDGAVDISHYLITVSNTSDGFDFTSGYIMPDSAYSLGEIPTGSYEVSVEAYIERVAGSYMLVASGESGAFELGPDERKDVTVTLDSFIEEPSGDVSISVILPDGLADKSYAYLSWSIEAETPSSDGTYASYLGNASRYDVVDGSITLLFDADNLLGGNETLNAGVYTLEVRVSDSSAEASETISRTGREAMRLLPGLAAFGTVDLSGVVIGDDFTDITIEENLGALEEFGFRIEAGYDGIGTLSIISISDEPINAREYTIFTDDIIAYGDEAEFSYAWFYDDEKGQRFVIHSLNYGKHTLIMIHNDGTPFGISSVATIFTMPSMETATLEYLDVILDYKIPEGYTNYGFADRYGNYASFPYTGLWDDVNEDGQVQYPEMGLTPIDYPNEVDGKVYTKIENGTILYCDSPSSDILPVLGGVEELYVAFAEGPTDLGATKTNGYRSGSSSTIGPYDMVHYLFPESIARIGSDVLVTLSEAFREDWTFRSTPEEDFPELENSDMRMSNFNVVGMTFLDESPYSVDRCFLYKDGPDGRELISMMTRVIDDMDTTGIIDGNRIILPEGIEVLRAGSLTYLEDIAGKTEGYDVLVMPSTLKKIEGPLVSRGDFSSISAILLNEGLEELGNLYIDYFTWSYEFDDCGMKIYIPSTVQSIEPMNFDDNDTVPEFYTPLDADAFSWEDIFKVGNEPAVVYFGGEWYTGDDGLPYANKLRTPEIRLVKSGDHGQTTYLLLDFIINHNDYRYTYTLDGSVPADPTEESPAIPDGMSDGRVNLPDIILGWDGSKELSIKVRVFHEGSEPSDTVTLTYTP